MSVTGYNFDGQSSNLLHIDDDYEHPMDLFEKWLKEAENNDDWAKVMNIATVHEKSEVLSRNVLLRKFNRSGFVFVTERNSRKYKDMKENAAVAATFFWKYKLQDNITLRQVRITGNALELSHEEISKLYSEEGLSTRIRCKICKCGQPCDWNELNKKHDDILQNFRNGTEKFEQNQIYTALMIQPKEMDFYYSRPNSIGDRIIYIKDKKGKWSHQRVYA